MKLYSPNSTHFAEPDKPSSLTAYDSGLNRRDFLKKSAIATLVASLLVSKPSIAKVFSTSTATTADFTTYQQTTLQAVQLQLFPNDGDGPSADDLHALRYLQWALTDPQNVEDGDASFIKEGLQWLDSFSEEHHKQKFITLDKQQQHHLLEQFSQTSSHENWMSLLVYYLLEALLLDPVYGGNPKGIGWKWLEHQAGFPRPDQHHTYRHYLNQKSAEKLA